MDTSWIAIIIVAITLIVFIIDRLPLAVTALISALALALSGSMAFNQVYAGLSSTLVVLVFGMMIVGDALFQTGLVLLIGKRIFNSRFAKNEMMLMVFLMIITGGLSAFLSNTATVATFIPLIGAIVLASNGRLKNKNLLMPIGMAASVGGTLTLVGSTAQPVVNTALINQGFAQIGVFDFAILAGPCFILLILYMVFWGYRMENRTFNFEDRVLSTDVDLEDIQVNSKTWIAGFTMLFCIVSFVTGILPIGMTALIGAAVVWVTGCVDFKQSLKRIDWNTVLLMAFAQGIAAGINDSGAGKMIANSAIGFIGSDFGILFSAAVLVTTLLTNIMSNTATAAMTAPIFIIIAQQLGYDPYAFALGIAVAANISIATPIGGTAMSQILVGGYGFKDYLKIGFPITLMMALLLCLLGALFLNY